MCVRCLAGPAMWALSTGPPPAHVRKVLETLEMPSGGLHGESRLQKFLENSRKVHNASLSALHAMTLLALHSFLLWYPRDLCR